MKPNHFLDLDKIDADSLRAILDKAAELKSNPQAYSLTGKQLIMIFEKPSTRTRVSFEVAINQLGGNGIILTSSDSQLGRGESVSDTAQVLSRYGDIIMIRTYKHETLLELAEYATIPVINGLTDYSHPCQVMADILTIEEKIGSVKDKVITWVGDGNNMANSWMHAAEKLGFHLHISCPDELSPPLCQSDYIKFFGNPKEAVEGADCVTTDTWVSMGDEDADYKREILVNYQVNDELMSLAKEDAIFLHCLPAHRDEEVTASVIDGPQSAVWDEAENRLHVQKAIMLWCLG